MDFLQALRLKNIFAPTDIIGNDLPSQGGITGNMPMSMPQMPVNTGLPTNSGMPPMDIPVTAGMSNFGQSDTPDWSPAHSAQDRFNTMLQQYPQDKGHGKLARLGASILSGVIGSSGNPHDIGLGIATGHDVLDYKHNQDIQDWKDQIGMAEKAADNERQSNTTEMYNRTKMRGQDITSANNQGKLDIAKTRADVYKFKSEHPGMKFNYNGPTVIASDPGSGQSFDTGLSTGHLTDQDKINLQTEGGIRKIEATGSQQRQTEGVKETNRQKDIAARGEQGRITKGMPSSNTTGKGTQKPESPSQTRVRQFNAARELYNTRPDLRPFIKIGAPGGNDFTVTPPSEGIFGHSGPTDKQYKEMQDAVYGTNATNAPAPMTSHSNASSNGVNLNVKAQKFLQDNNLPVTPANIAHAIKTGRVK